MRGEPASIVVTSIDGGRFAKPAPESRAGGKTHSAHYLGGRTTNAAKANKNAAREEPIDADSSPLEDCPRRSRWETRRCLVTGGLEPKLITIFLREGMGMTVNQPKVTLDGTLLGPTRTPRSRRCTFVDTGPRRRIVWRLGSPELRKLSSTRHAKRWRRCRFVIKS